MQTTTQMGMLALGYRTCGNKPLRGSQAEPWGFEPARHYI